MVDISQLNPDIKTFLDKLGDATIDESASLDIAKGREDYLMFALTNAGWPLTMPCVRDLLIPSADLSYQIPIRIYTPILDKKLPALIYYHGGGWQRGDIATHDSICRHFARLAECIVVSVQWRLAPEHRFPIGSYDCFNAYAWVTEHGERYNIDLRRLAIGGDSAGGNMAAVTLLRLRDTQLVKPIFQLLLYPALDLSCAGWSYIDFADGFFLTTARVKYYVKSYLNPSDDVTNPLISPLMQSDFSYIPRTHIVTAGFDPLRSDGEAYVQRLRAANVPVSYHCYEEMIHAFLHMNHTVPAVRKAFQDISSVLKEGLS